MKKVLILSYVVAIILFSCKKEHAIIKNIGVKKYRVTFNVTNFTQHQSTFALRHSANHLASSDTLTQLSNYLDKLYYVVINSSNVRERVIVQDSTMSNMGMITDSLPPGIYRIAIVAGKNGLQLPPDNGSISLYYDYGGLPWQDTFWHMVTVTVGNSDINQNITLSRVVAKLELVLSGVIPENADTLFIKLSGAVQKSLLDSSVVGSNFNGDTFPVVIPASAKGKPGFTVDRLTGYSPAIDYLRLRSTDASGHVIKDVLFGPNTGGSNGIPFKDNVKTIVTVPGGDFFGVQQALIIKADTAWNSTPSQTFHFSLRRPK